MQPPADGLYFGFGLGPHHFTLADDLIANNVPSRETTIVCRNLRTPGMSPWKMRLMGRVAYCAVPAASTEPEEIAALVPLFLAQTQ